MDDLAMTVEDQHIVSAMWNRHLFQQQEAMRRHQAEHLRIRLPGMILAFTCFAIGMLNIGAGSSVCVLSDAADEGLMLFAAGFAIILLSIPVTIIITKVRRNHIQGPASAQSSIEQLEKLQQGRLNHGQ